MDISNLPSSIIDNILVRLPLVEILRTSILSRAWRYKWTSVPELEFHIFLDPMITEREIYRVLHKHRGPLYKFSITHVTGPHIDQWIMLLPSCQIQDFKLKNFGGKHDIPSHFFTFQNLKHLVLEGCMFKPPPEFKGFSKLATLFFYDVDYVPAILEQLISRSPLLEMLTLDRCTELDAFEVHGPSLKLFSFDGIFKSICFKNSPVLADIYICMPNSGIPSFTGFKYSQLPSTVEKLSLQPCVLEVTVAGGVPKCFANSLNALKVLSVTLYLPSIKVVASVLCLVRSSPNLQILRINGWTKWYDVAAVEGLIEFMRVQETPDPYSHQHKRVEISFYHKYEPQIELVRLLLASAAGLEEMVIITYASIAGYVMKRLKQFPRASSTALLLGPKLSCLCFFIAAANSS